MPKSAPMAGFVYIVSNKRDGTLYVGVTSNLSRRAFEHREGAVEGFASRCGLKRLVYCEILLRHPRRLAVRKKYEALAATLEACAD